MSASLIIRYTVGFAIVVLRTGGIPCAAQEANKPIPLGDEKISCLVRQLSHRKFSERELATKQLAAAQDAAPAVESLLHSPDADLRERAERIVREYDRLGYPERLRKAVDFGKAGRLDAMAELLTFRNAFLEVPEDCQRLLDIVATFRDLSPLARMSSAYRFSLQFTETDLKLFRREAFVPHSMQLTGSDCDSLRTVFATASGATFQFNEPSVLLSPPEPMFLADLTAIVVSFCVIVMC